MSIEAYKPIYRRFIEEVMNRPYVDRMSSFEAWRVQDRRNAELWSQVDSLGILHQLGVMPAPREAGAVISATLVSTETGGECRNTCDFRSVHAWEFGWSGCWRA